MPLHDVLRQRVQPLTSALTSNRIFLYCVFSTFAVIATTANACRAHSSFYSVAIYLANSSRSVLILANFGFLASLLFGRILQKLFFGALQPREVERLYDQTWMFVTESLLAFTIFRDEFDVPFLLMFGFLLFVKCFHWLMADRVESMDQTNYPGPPTLFHIRINSLFFVLWAVDAIMFALAVESTMSNGVGGMVLFASEYAILLASALNAMLRYTLSILDIRRARARGGENAPPWENKSMYIFYIELLTDFLKLTTYMTFFLIILTFYGLPLNILRDFFFTARSFVTRLRALIRYLNATRDMDRRYPDATEAELVEMSDRTCIICREEMQSRNLVPPQDDTVPPPNGEPQQQQHPLPPVDGPNMTPKKLPCGHIFHFQCLRSWLERQQSCPTCRRTVLETNPPAAQDQAPAQGQARPAPPRPGAAPVPGAPLGAPAPVNPLGWVGRVLGLPPQPAAVNPQFPGVQGQFAQAPGPPFHQQQPLANAQLGAQPVAGQPLPQPYYDAMHGWQQQVPGQAPQLQPPPVFRGFYGPGQVWYPWGDPRWLAPQPPGELRQDLPVATQPPTHTLPGVPPPTVDERPQSRITQDASQASTPTPTTNADVAGDARQPTSPQPEAQERLRLAAAKAALERLAKVAGSHAARPLNGDGVANRQGTSAAAAAARDASAPDANAQLSPLAEASAPSISTPVPSTSAALANGAIESRAPPTASPPLPPLIPLYDPSTVQPPARGCGAPQQYLRTYRGHPLSSFYPSQVRGTAQPPRAGPSSSSSSGLGLGSGSSPGLSSGSGSGSARTPLGQLPAALTEEQLARLDGLTREAIDERLRVLEGVSGAVFRCVEELTRMRSVLPQVGVRREGEGAPASSGSAAGAGEGVSGGGGEEEESSAVAARKEANGKAVARENGRGGYEIGDGRGGVEGSETEEVEGES